MRKIFLLTILVIPICLWSQRRPKIKGSRQVIEVSDDLPPFNAIELIDDLEIQLKHSVHEGYFIKADDNLVDLIKMDVKDSILFISSFYNIKSKKKLEITINYAKLNQLTQKDGKIKMAETMEVDDFSLTVLGKSRAEFDVNVTSMNIKMEENAKAKINIDADSLNVKLKGRAKLDSHAEIGGMNVRLMENTDLEITGTAQNALLTTSKNAQFKGQQLQVGEMELRLTESGQARVRISNVLNLDSGGSGKTYLYGEECKINILSFRDNSQMIKKDK